MKTVLIFQLLAGLAVAFIVPVSGRLDVIRLWSDFKAFEARVAKDEAGARILKYGGENPNEDFDQLIKQLSDLQPSPFCLPLGLFISATAVCGLFLQSSVKHNKNDKLHTKA